MQHDDTIELHLSDISLAAGINQLFQVHGPVTHRLLWTALTDEHDRRRRSPGTAAPIRLERSALARLSPKTLRVLGLE